MTTTEGNKLIEGFAPEIVKKMQWSIPKHIAEHDGLKFHISWDWLMPVVEKIESLRYDTRISMLSATVGDGTRWRDNLMDIETWNGKLICTSKEETKIKTVYSAVIQFIEWYNKNQQQ